MGVPQQVKENFVYIGDRIGKIGEAMERYPAETIGLGGGFFGGLLVEGFAHVTPSSYNDFYNALALTPGQPTAITTGVGAAAVLTYKGLRWLHETYKNWKNELESE